MPSCVPVSALVRPMTVPLNVCSHSSSRCCSFFSPSRLQAAWASPERTWCAMLTKSGSLYEAVWCQLKAMYACLLCVSFISQYVLLIVVVLLAFLFILVQRSYLVRSPLPIFLPGFSQLLDFEHEFECINATDLPVLPLKRLQRATRRWTGELFYLSALWRINTTANRRLEEERQADTVRQPRLDLYLTDTIWPVDKCILIIYARGNEVQ